MSNRTGTERALVTGRAVLLVLLLGLLAGCGGSSNPSGVCASERDCPGGAHCIDGRCIGTDGGGDLEPADDADDGGDGWPGDGWESDGTDEGTAEGSGDGDDDGAGGDGDGDGDGAGDGEDDAADDGGTCVDLDGDGHGAGCAAGSDCDDTDPLHFNDCADCDTTHAPGCPCVVGDSFACYTGPAGTLGVGACAAGVRECVGGFLPEACPGEVLPAAVETCGDGIDNDCNGRGDDEVYGPCGDCDVTCRTDGPIEPAPSDPGASGLGTNPVGSGVVLGSEEIRAGFLWAANSPEGTVSKLDLTTGAEVARYRVGSDPSRTAVDSVGNAYVADRGGSGAAKMAGDRHYCIDRNGSTVIDTSTGPSAMALDTDECVLWRVSLGSPGALPRAVAVDFGDAAHPEGYPWFGVFQEMRAYKLHPDTGAVLETVDLSINTYGFAIDSNGWIWISGISQSAIQRFHTVTRTVEPPIPLVSGCGGMPYGIAVDVRNRVWVGVYGGGQACAARYDPATGGWFTAGNTRDGWVGRGIAADADGTIWMAIHGGGAIVSFYMDDGSDLVVRDIAGVIPVGVGVDELGHVWTVNQATSNVTRLTKATGALEEFPVGPNPYTYSDFTGYQRRLMIPRGTWTRDYERCAVDGFDRWGDLSWDADVPPGATLTISGASAETSAGLDAAPDVTLATIPADVPPVDLEAVFAAAGVPLHRHLRVTVTLVASPDRASPVFRSLDVRWHCYRMP